MPIDRDQAMAYEFPEGTGSYTNDEVILYHLGVGAGVPATDAGELEYTYEKDLKVLPSFVTTVLLSGGGSMMSVPGLEFNPMMLLHGEQDIEIHRPLPPEAKMKGRTRIADIFDKGKAALTILENSVSTEDGEPLFTTRMALFMRGEGGFGGESGPPAANQAPDREPDAVFESETLPQQALLYRLNGDKNPLHCDPEFAAMGGFDVPIIHGLCSYGITCKAVVDGMLDGDPTRLARYQARFKGVAWPGETYQVRCWNEDGKILVEAWSKDRNEAIITNAAVTLG